MKDAALRTWSAIGKALASGDLALAAKIASATLQVVWQTGLHKITSIFVKAWTSIEGTWDGTIGYLRDTWANWVTYFMASWHMATGVIRKAWLKLQSYFDSSIDVEAETQKINQKVATSIVSDGVDAVNEKLARDRELRNAAAEREAAAAARIQKSEEAVAAARAEWAKSIAQVENADIGAAPGASGPGGVPDLDTIDYNIQGGAAAFNRTAARGEAKGGFNAFSLAGQGADSLAEKLNGAMNDVAENTAQLLDKARAGRLVFTNK